MQLMGEDTLCTNSNTTTMPKGGQRDGAGRPGNWKSGKTRAIRVPDAFADRLLELARQADSGDPSALYLTDENLGESKQPFSCSSG